MNYIGEALIILPTGLVLLRLAGKKIVAEMTTLEIITTLAIGTLISHAITEEGVWKTITAMAVIVFFCIITQLLQLKLRWFENLFIGKVSLVVSDGQIINDTLKKLRMTSQQLEMRLRQQGINSINKVKTATIEANGQLGFELYPDAEPVTYGELIKIIKQLMDQEFVPPQRKVEPNENNLFSKI